MLSAILQGLFRQISPIASWSESTPKQTHLSSLPPELIYMILEYLPPDSATSFLLASSWLYEFRDESATLEPADKENLLALLERDLPKRYLCHTCNKLHFWISDRSRRVPVYDGNCRRRVERDDRFPSLSYSVQYPTARLIMNRHLYSAAHGPPLSEFRKEMTRRLYDGACVKSSWDVRVIDGELFTCERAMIYPVRRDSTQLKNYLELCFKICHHLTPQSNIPELASNIRLGRLFAIIGQLRSCALCFTDYQMDVLPGGMQEGRIEWVLRCTKWHQLGSCRSPGDSKWKLLISESTVSGQVPRFVDCEAGLIAKKWMLQDGRGTIFSKGGFSGISPVDMQITHLLIELGFTLDIALGWSPGRDSNWIPQFYIRGRRGGRVFELRDTETTSFL